MYAFHNQGRQTSLPPLRDMLPCGPSSSTVLLSHEGPYGMSKGGELEAWGCHPYLQLRGIQIQGCSIASLSLSGVVNFTR